MNANKLSPKADVRMNRIQKVSKCIRLFLQCSFWFWLVILIGQIMWAFALDAHPNNPHAVPPKIACLEMTRMILRLTIIVLCNLSLLKLFRLFENGILFTAKSVRCLQILGGLCVAKWLLELSFSFLLANAESPLVTAGLSDLFAGLLIIFIGWLIDEARKIQEEQELTV
jgi:hypothetical protein